MKTKTEEKIAGEAGEYFEDWLEGLSRATATQYLYHFKRFLGWLGMDAQELYERHRDNLASSEPIKKMWLGKRVTGYQKHMRDELGYSIEGEASGTVLIVQKAVVGFLKSVGIEDLPGKGRIKVRVDEIPNIPKGDLRRVFNATGSYKNRAFIHFAKDAGLRTGDITNLPLGIRGDGLSTAAGMMGELTLLEAIGDETVEFFTFEWKTQKTSLMANPAIGPEALEALREWMRHRTEKLGLPARDSDPMFCTEKTRKGFTTKKGKEVKGTNAGEYMDESNMSVIFGQLVAKAGLKETGVSIHSLRKYHKTNLEAGGCPTSWANKMQGRKGVGTGGIYTKPNPKQLLGMYAKAYHAIRVLGGGEPTTRDEIALEALRAVATTFGIDPARLVIGEVSAAAEIDLLKGAIEAVQRPGVLDVIRTEQPVQLVIEEGDLQKHLDAGWRFKATLNNGSRKVIVEK